MNVFTSFEHYSRDSQIQGKGIPEFMTNLVYRASSRTDSATEKPLFKANQQTNNKNIQKIVIKK